MQAKVEGIVGNFSLEGLKVSVQRRLSWASIPQGAMGAPHLFCVCMHLEYVNATKNAVIL